MLPNINMPISEKPRSIRDCAQKIIAAIAQSGDDYPALASALRAPVADLVKNDNLVALGAPRQGNNVASSHYLYFDGQLSILLFEVPSDRTIPPHDHGIWEAFCTYRGRVRHQTLRRIDDESVSGYAELETLSDDILGAGELTIIAPPADIHSFTALETGTLGLTIANGPYKRERHYYQPENNSYVVKPQVNFR
ncbi:MAG: putative metal-dependent enzyme (double-stranded beta helix superfamily) [Gammaproteobacteria bacterium]|jgi:predicted metal-dependent enzyme (double-stranded beta helix superfamily)